MKSIDFLPAKRRARRFRVFISLILLMIVVFAVRGAEVKWDLVKFREIDNELFQLFGSVILSMASSVAAAYVFLALYENEQAQIDKMRKLTDPIFLNAFLNDLASFRGRTCEDYNVNIVLSPFPNNLELLTCTIHYIYKKHLEDREIKFKLLRVRSDSQQSQTNNHYEEFFSNESYFSLDERTFRATIAADNYVFRKVVINATHIELLSTALPSDSTVIEFRGKIPNTIQLDEMVHLSYEVSFPLERESFLAINFELPTKATRVTLNYEALQNEIEMGSSTFITSLLGPTPISDKDKSYVLDFAHEGWVLPKNGIIFIWWKKDLTIMN